jgi:hypothetical protein
MFLRLGRGVGAAIVFAVSHHSIALDIHVQPVNYLCAHLFREWYEAFGREKSHHTIIEVKPAGSAVAQT